MSKGRREARSEENTDGQRPGGLDEGEGQV